MCSNKTKNKKQKIIKRSKNKKNTNDIEQKNEAISVK